MCSLDRIFIVPYRAPIFTVTWAVVMAGIAGFTYGALPGATLAVAGLLSHPQRRMVAA